MDQYFIDMKIAALQRVVAQAKVDLARLTLAKKQHGKPGFVAGKLSQIDSCVVAAWHRKFVCVPNDNPRVLFERDETTYVLTGTVEQCHEQFDVYHVQLADGTWVNTGEPQETPQEAMLAYNVLTPKLERMGGPWCRYGNRCTIPS